MKPFLSQVRASIRIASWVAIAILTLARAQGSDALKSISYESDIRPLLEKYCYSCHGEEKQKGDVQLSSFHDKRMLVREHELWREVIYQIESEEMPEKEPLPTPEERRLLVDWLEHTLNEIDWSQVKSAGHVTLPRLTNEEYNNTMRDLLGIDIRPGDSFLEDGEGQSGFNNDRDSLFITPSQMEKYFQAAERSIEALLHHNKDPIALHYESEDMFMTETRETPKEFGNDFRGYVINRGQMTLYDSIEFPYDGIYRFKARALSTKGPTGSRLRINDEVKGDIKVLSEEPAVYEITAFVPAGENQVAWNIEIPPIHYDPPENNEDSNSNLRPQSVAVDWIQIEGPIDPTPEGQVPLVISSWPKAGNAPETAAQEILEEFLPRAFRRPVSKSERERYLQLFTSEMAAEQTFESAIRTTLAAALVSPHFLYRPELGPSSTNKEYPLNDYQLASRLSYFLWMSMPDEELLLLAEKKRLRKPRTLRQQVRRMLEDPRAKSTARTFLGQWLGFEALGDTVVPDSRTYPEFTPAINRAMKDEVYFTFDHLMANNGSALELLDSTETFLDQGLAEHYGIEGVTGPEMRRVSLDDPNRGGLLGMGSILTATSNPARTNPVSRGKWVLETLLGSRIPEPPADAGILPENAGRVKGKTLREEFEMHRRNPSCIDCHEKIDPIGFGLENFDGIGRFRESENGKPIDSSGRLPDGTSFTGPAELKQYIISSKKDDFVRNLCEKVLAFALGRDLQHYDEAAIIKLVAAMEKKQYKIRTLFEEVALSYPFRYQHPNPEYEQTLANIP
jgi:hypothetical protein